VKKLLVVFIFLLVIVVVGSLVAPSFIDWNSYKTQATEQIKSATGLDVSLKGDLAFSILPLPKLMAHDITILSPEDAKFDSIASLERFDVNVALMPLLSGKVDVQSVSLIEPNINIEVDKNGKLLLMTDKLNALMTTKEDGKAPLKSSSMPDISFRNVTVKNATITYYDHKSGSQHNISNINFDLAADNLTGPYDINGHLFHEGRALNINLETGQLDLEGKVVSLKSKVSITPDDISLGFAGALNFDAEPSLQGQLQFESTAKAPYITKPVKGQGLLTADKNAIKFTDMEIASAGDISVSGDASYEITASKFAANLKSGKSVNAKALLGNAFPFETISFDISASGDLTKISIKDSKIILDKSQLLVSADYLLPVNGRSKLDMDVSSENLDLRKLSASSQGNAKIPLKKSLQDTAKSLTLPFDLDIAANIKNLKYADFDLRDLILDASINKNSANITDFKTSNFHGATIGVKGKVADIKSIAGIDLDTSITVTNISVFKKLIMMEQNPYAVLLDKATISSKLDGGIESVNLTSNIAAQGANIYVKGKVSDPVGSLAISGLSLQVKHPNTQKFLTSALGFADMGYDLSKTLDFYTDLSMSGNEIKLANIKASISSIPLSGAITVTMKDPRPYVAGDFKTGTVKLISSSAATRSAERWSKEPISTAAFGAADAKITFAAEKILKDLIVFNQPSFNLSLKNGKMDISNFKAGIFDGSLAMEMSIQTVPEQERQPLHITAKTKLSDISLRKAAEVLVSRTFAKAEGTVGADIDIKTSGLNQAAMIYDLSGSALLNGKAITVHGLDIKRFARALSAESKTGDSVLGLWKSASSGGSTYFDTLDGQFSIKEGIININKLDLDGPQAYLQTSGNVNLPKWSLSTKHKISVKTEVEGEAEIPSFEIGFSGPLDNPSQTFGQGLLKDYLNRKINRKINDILTDAIGGSRERSNDSGQDVQQQEPASGGNGRPEPKEVIKDVLKDLLR